MIFRAAIFDLDGTLIDSLADIGEAMNRTLAAQGFGTHPLDAYRYFVGDGVHQLIRNALPKQHHDDATVERCLKAYRADYTVNWKNRTRAYDGIPELLKRLVGASVPIGVLSNKPDGVTRTCVEHFFPDIPFIAVAGQREDVPRKPDPTAALRIAESMNIEPAECVFVGDTATDMKTATAARMFPAGVTWGFRPESELLNHGARLIAHHPEALAGLFGAG